MISVYSLKPRFQALLRPLCRWIAPRVSANQVTVGAMLLSVIPGAMLIANPGAVWPLFLMPIVLFVRMALNAIDGMLAREFNQSSRLGAVLNELGDVVSDVLLYLPLALIPGISPLLIGLLVLVAVIGEMAGVIGTQIGASRRYDGPFGKSDRALFFGTLVLAIASGAVPGVWSDGLLALGLIGGCLTIVNRVRGALREPVKPAMDKGEMA